MDARKVFGTNVRRLRLEKGLSQEEFGFAAGIDRTYVSGVERGIRNPSLLLADKFANALGVELSELLRQAAPS
ncbi:helix-turn-helix domain-containing protein [Tsuneonella sp. HG094]